MAARRAIELDLGLAEGYAALGSAYLSRHWYTSAEEAFGRALALNPNLAIAVARSGFLKFNSGQYEAVRLYRRSRALEPAARTRALAQLALTYGALGMMSRAYETNDLLLALEPDNRETHRIWKVIKGGRVVDREGLLQWARVQQPVGEDR